jgi:hypothetical protein
MRAEANELPGVVLERAPLRARVVDNGRRLMPLTDTVAGGMNGLASLIHEGLNKNIFASCGMNLEECKTTPPAGAVAGRPQAPRHAPMALRREGESAVLTQSAQEGAGLNFRVAFALGDSCVDQTITAWPDHDITYSNHFYASYMNQVQNTSIFLRGRLEGEAEARWLEATSPGHGGDGAVFYRPVEPEGRAWHEFLRDNPVLRQKRFRDAESIAGAERAGFRPGKLAELGGFFFGFVDDYLALYIFREPVFHMWISASGATAVRSPAWDYFVNDGPQRAGERRSYHVRLVHKPYAGVEDVLAEAARFRKG